MSLALRASLFRTASKKRRAFAPAVFLDKDGTLIEDVPFNVDPALIRLAPRAGEALHRLHGAGFKLIVVSNQSGVARGLFPETALQAVEDRLGELLARHGVGLDGFYYCPHHPAGTVPDYTRACSCRKPAPGLILRAAADLQVDLQRSWLIGDILNDVEAGFRAGCRTVLLDNGNETEWELSRARVPDCVLSDLINAADHILSVESRRERLTTVGLSGNEPSVVAMWGGLGSQRKQA